jgi:hypothetical protein
LDPGSGMGKKSGSEIRDKHAGSAILLEIMCFMTTLLFLANHLLLLDPAWNPAAEWQCFDRVHRLGQDKEVFIYKFITKVSLPPGCYFF